jgi:hypothetical protein
MSIKTIVITVASYLWLVDIVTLKVNRQVKVNHLRGEPVFYVEVEEVQYRRIPFFKGQETVTRRGYIFSRTSSDLIGAELDITKVVFTDNFRKSAIEFLFPASV